MVPPLIPDTPPGVAPIVQLGVGDRYDASGVAGRWGGPGVDGAARWSTPGPENTWGAQEPLWLDITCEVLDITTFSGRETSIDQFDIGTATIVVRNLDGWADYRPTGLHNPLLTVRPGRQIRVGVSLAGGAAAWLWRGTIDVTEPGYVPGEGDTVTFGCIDAKGDAGRVEMPRTLTPVGEGEWAHYRYWRILDNVAWPTFRRYYDETGVTLHATELGTRATDELDRTAESASGHVYGDLNGFVRFRRRDWMVYPAGTPMDATIGNIGAADVCPSGWEERFGRADITTRVIVGRPGETPLVWDNEDGKGEQGVETWTRTDLIPTDNFELIRIGSRALSVRSPAVMPRIAAVTLNASTGDGEVAALLATASPFTPSRYRCRHRSSDGRLVFDRNMMVVGISHTLSPRDGWTARLALDDATPYQQTGNPARWSNTDTRWSDDDEWALTL